MGWRTSLLQLLPPDSGKSATTAPLCEFCVFLNISERRQDISPIAASRCHLKQEVLTRRDGTHLQSQHLRLRKEDRCEREASLDYKGRPCLETPNNKEHHMDSPTPPWKHRHSGPAQEPGRCSLPLPASKPPNLRGPAPCVGHASPHGRKKMLTAPGGS